MKVWHLVITAILPVSLAVPFAENLDMPSTRTFQDDGIYSSKRNVESLEVVGSVEYNSKVAADAEEDTCFPASKLLSQKHALNKSRIYYGNPIITESLNCPGPDWCYFDFERIVQLPPTTNLIIQDRDQEPVIRRLSDVHQVQNSSDYR